MAQEFWFKFNFKDWANDVKPLSLTARGLLLELIIYLRQTDQVGRMPVDVRLLVRLSGGLTEEITESLTEFKKFGCFDFVVDEAGVEWLVSRRIEREFHKSLINKENGKKGGNPKLVGLTDGLTDSVKRTANRTSNSNSISNSNSLSLTEKGLSREKHKPSSPDEVGNYFLEIGLPYTEGQKFWDHFSSNGWKIGGKAPMKDWKAACRTWKRNHKPSPNEDNRRVYGKVTVADIQSTFEILKKEEDEQLRDQDN